MKGSSYSLRVMKNAKQYNKPPVPQHGTLLEVPLEGSPSVSSQNLKYTVFQNQLRKVSFSIILIIFDRFDLSDHF